jgi:hypothetical protein
VAFASWKLAVILEGVVARHATGAYGEGDDSWRRFAEVVVQLADRALELTDPPVTGLLTPAGGRA